MYITTVMLLGPSGILIESNKQKKPPIQRFESIPCTLSCTCALPWLLTIIARA